MIIKISACLTLIFSSFILLYLAFNPIFFSHLQTDVVVFSQRAQFFLENHNLSNFSNNEYQPGAILFFIMLSPFLSFGGYETFKIALFATNLLLIFANGIIFWQLRGSRSLFIFSLLLLAIGPILFFRFDLLAVTLVSLSFYFWLKDKELLSIFILGTATLVKIYPILFIPYLLITTWQSKGIKKTIIQLLTYLSSILYLLVLYVTLFQANLADIFSSLNYHALKPISTDNIYGLFAIFYNLIAYGKYPQLISAYGTNGFSNQDAILPLFIYNYFWIIPFILLHLLLIRKKVYGKINGLIFCLTNLLFFLIFTKSQAPQYLIWFIALIPLLPTAIFKTKSWFITLILLLLSLFFYQYIYPLNYDAWLDGLRPPYNFHELLVVNILRNIFLLVVSIHLILVLLRNRIIA